MHEKLVMKHLYDSENVLITLLSGQEMCRREMGTGGDTLGERKRDGDGNRLG